jgi:hypothetical protein
MSGKMKLILIRLTLFSSVFLLDLACPAHHHDHDHHDHHHNHDHHHGWIYGDKGKQGNIGPKGPTGKRGPQGPVGGEGFPGQQGKRGPRGNQGIQGIEGLPGLSPPGPKGLTGKTGSPGPVGPTGEQGLPGPQGPQGENGCDGRDGKNAIGTQGPPGLDGRNGRYLTCNSETLYLFQCLSNHIGTCNEELNKLKACQLSHLGPATIDSQYCIFQENVCKQQCSFSQNPEGYCFKASDISFNSSTNLQNQQAICLASCINLKERCEKRVSCLNQTNCTGSDHTFLKNLACTYVCGANSGACFDECMNASCEDSFPVPFDPNVKYSLKDILDTATPLFNYLGGISPTNLAVMKDSNNLFKLFYDKTYDTYNVMYCGPDDAYVGKFLQSGLPDVEPTPIPTPDNECGCNHNHIVVTPPPNPPTPGPTPIPDDPAAAFVKYVDYSAVVAKWKYTSNDNFAQFSYVLKDSPLNNWVLYSPSNKNSVYIGSPTTTNPLSPAYIATVWEITPH